MSDTNKEEVTFDLTFSREEILMLIRATDNSCNRYKVMPQGGLVLEQQCSDEYKRLHSKLSKLI